MPPSPGETQFYMSVHKFPFKSPNRFGIFGGVSFPPHGTFTEYIVVERDQVFLTPEYLDDVHIAAWPVGGLTAWRYRKPFIIPSTIFYLLHLPEPLPSMPKSNMDIIF